MRNILIMLMIFFFWSCTSCNSETPGSDVDNETPDIENDNVSVEVDKSSDNDFSNNDDDFVVDEDEPEIDEENDDESQDYSKPWLVDGDPYSDRDNYFYEYSGDYDVVTEDTEKVRDLWRYNFTAITEKLEDMCSEGWIQPFEACGENYPFEPVIVENYPYEDNTSIKNPYIKNNACDGFLTPEIRWKNDWVYGRDPNYIAKNGKVIFKMSSIYCLYGSKGTYMVDIPRRQIIKIATPYSDMAFNGKTVFMTIYDESKNYDYPDLPNYEMPRQEVIYYDTETHKYGYAWYGDKFYGAIYVGLSDSYAMISYQTLPDSQGEMKVVYTKIGDWKNWKELKKFTTGDDGYVIARFPHMVGSQLVFQNYEIATIFCDLDKGDDGCVKISLDDEKTYFPKIIGDRKIVYMASSVDGSKINEIVQVELNEDGSVKSREAIVQDSKINGIMDVNEEYVLYAKKMGETANEHPITMFCMYRMSDKQSFCVDGVDDMEIRKDYSYLSGGGHYLVYQHYFDIVVRDMECYCDHNPTRCPYSDYTPNTVNPKVPEWKK